MRGRRRKKADGLPSRVYAKCGSYYWVCKSNGKDKWILLCRVDQGRDRMLQRLVDAKRKAEAERLEGTMSVIVAEYIEKQVASYKPSFQNEWRRQGEDVRAAFRAFDIEQVDTATVMDFLDNNWPDKLRMKQAMKGWLSKFFTWATQRGYVLINPCREVTTKRPKRRKVYIKHAHFIAIRQKLAVARDGKRTPTGAMMQVFVDLCYLTCQRSTDIRSLKWAQIDEEAELIHFEPSKTEDSSGEVVDWPITPEIAAVLKRASELEPVGSEYLVRDPDGKPRSAAACRDAWRDAKDRAGLKHLPYTIKDIRRMAITDANRAGYDIRDIQVAAAHADLATTEDYIEQLEVPVSKVHLRLPMA